MYYWKMCMGKNIQTINLALSGRIIKLKQNVQDDP